MENKKLLGQFNRKVGLQYQSLLEEAGVNVIVEDWSNSFELIAGTALVRLLVPNQDYEKSINLIKEFERNTTKQLTESADKTRNQETLQRVKQLKKDFFIGFWLWIPVSCIFFSIFESAFPRIFNSIFNSTEDPSWFMSIWLVGYSTIFMYIPIKRLSNIQCPNCERRLKLNIFSNPAKIACIYCGNLISPELMKK